MVRRRALATACFFDAAVGLQICLKIQFSLRSFLAVYGFACQQTMFACVRSDGWYGSPLDQPGVLR